MSEGPARGLGENLTVHPSLIERYEAEGWWISDSCGELLAHWAERKPDEIAIVDDQGRHTWSDYHRAADDLARTLAGLGIDAEASAAVWLDDSFEFHVALVAAERARVVALGVGARARVEELAHLMRGAGAQALITTADHRGQDTRSIAEQLRERGVDLRYLLLMGEEFEVVCLNGAPAPTPREPGEGFGPNDFSLLNSTSGTTGLPKRVAHTANQWFAFAVMAQQSAGLGDDEVFGGFVPGPFGFGLWTSHYAPLYLGARTVLTARFTATKALELIEREQITFIACVSTQFKMMLNDPAIGSTDFSSLRVMYSGGEAVPAAKAREFEEYTDSVVLQFFGSNEIGAASMTTPDMTAEQRLATAGRLIECMDVAVYDEAGQIITDPLTPGQPAARGPLNSLGYHGDEAANDQLYSPHGRMLMADLVTVDTDGFLRVVGRKTDIIIRGGKNISALEVEAAVESHPRVGLAAVVPVPDELFGEKVCAVVETHDGAELTLAELTEHLAGSGLGRESWPEYVVTHGDLPRSSGGKLAKREVRSIALGALAMDQT
ncbi:class I adenylate-forming enzyme family protein [Enemella sp. A6]|uniref:class I adenylate-forming enzyme family protein n=1 Tax=Enemella sp. A6 TaxID=3440152 RepID=UPI003EBC2019